MKECLVFSVSEGALRANKRLQRKDGSYEAKKLGSEEEGMLSTVAGVKFVL